MMGEYKSPNANWREKCEVIVCRECGGEKVRHNSLANILNNVDDVKCTYCEGLGVLFELECGWIKTYSGDARGYDRKGL